MAALRGAFVAGAWLALAAGAPAQTMGPNGLPILAPNVVALNDINQALREGDKETALLLAEEARAEFPRDIQLRFVRAVVLDDFGRTAEAVTEFESINSDFPELPEPYNNLAVIFANEGKYAQAERLLQQALTARPGYVTARENLGDLYVAMAVDAYQRAGKLDPTSTALVRKLSLARELNVEVRKARNLPVMSLPLTGPGAVNPQSQTPTAAPAGAPRSPTP